MAAASTVWFIQYSVLCTESISAFWVKYFPVYSPSTWDTSSLEPSFPLPYSLEDSIPEPLWDKLEKIILAPWEPSAKASYAAAYEFFWTLSRNNTVIPHNIKSITFWLSFSLCFKQLCSLFNKGTLRRHRFSFSFIEKYFSFQPANKAFCEKP